MNDLENRDNDAETIIAPFFNAPGIISPDNSQVNETADTALQGLAGAPHWSPRHPDIPRGVDHLCRDRSKRGLPVCAYVKNRRATGGYYWDFSMTTVVAEGVLSVPTHPEVPHFQTARDIYRDLLVRERHGLSPDESAQAFLAALAARGFDGYDTFMQSALAEECRMRATDTAPGECSLPRLDHLGRLLDAAEGLAELMGRDFTRVRSEPVNMRILAGRLEGASAALDTISRNYDVMASEMQHLVEKLRYRDSGALGRMRGALDRGRFLAQVALLMKQAAAQPDSDDAAQLPNQAAQLVTASNAALTEIAATARSVPETCRQLRHRINGLNVAKLLCRVESSRMQNADPGLNGIIARLDRFHADTETNLAALTLKADQITCKSLTI